MEFYISFLSYMFSAGSMVLNLFGSLKPIAAALVNISFQLSILNYNYFFLPPFP